MLDVPLSDIKQFRQDLMNYFEANCSDIISEINEKKVMSEDLENRIVEAAKAFKGN
jgi:F-type H+-transporting ATPase subunit alpha